MAFVSQANRGIERFPPPQFKAAPGSYQTIQRATYSHNYAPFSSTSLREFPTSNAYIPGPGSYVKQRNLWCQSMTTYSNNNNILIKLNSIGTTPFQSKQKRFDNHDNSIPGPGEYLVNQQTSNKKYGNQIIKKNKVFNTLKSKPSISKTIYLSQRAKTEEREYHQRDRRNTFIVDWSRNRRDRFQNDKISELGPGKYEPQRVIQKRAHSNPSNFFLSGTVRTFDTIYYKANNTDMLSLRQRGTFKTQQPAPGSYNISVAKQNQSQKYKNKSFGSSKGRFEKSKTEEDYIIPFYDVGKAYDSRSFHKKSIPFNSETKKQQQNQPIIPGPGYYSLDRKPKIRTSVENFGSKVQRSTFEQKRNNIGPGTYQSTITNHQSKKQSNIFSSKIARPFQIKQKTDSKFAAYDLSQSDISRKAFEHRIHRQNLESIDSAKPPFDRQTPRFRHYEPAEEKKKPLTIQQIENIMRLQKQEERFRLIDQARMQVEGQKGFLARGGERFKESKGGPGVGEYTIRDKWTKKSYNVKYGIQ